MKIRCWFVLLCIFALVAPLRAAEPGPVFVVPLKTDVSQAQFFFLRRALKEAERAGASAFVIDMSTNGGAVDAALENMDALMKSGIPTYTYINPRALSAGALIALATQKIYMSPTGVIGAAAPVMAGGEDLPKTASDKTVSALSAMARAAAEKNGHRPELADAFIRKEFEYKIGEEVIDKADTLLSLSGPEAVKVYGDRPLLATGLADSLEDMLKKAGLSTKTMTISPTGFEQVAFWITALAPLFMLGGLLGAYIEFKTPGFGLPGLLSVCCFIVFFTGHYLAGLAGWEVGALFVVGLFLVLGELFLHPGTVVPGIVGAILMIGALLWAMIDRYPGQPFLPTTDMLFRPLANLAVAFLLTIIVGWWLAKYLPKTRFYGHIVLQTAVGGEPETMVAPAVSRLAIGVSGKALSTLRPAGKAEFEGQLVDVTSRGDYIDAGTSVRIVAVDGMGVVVERA